jgi:hypothetical protein
MIGFGLDLSGYSTGRTVLAAVQMSGDAGAAAILRGSAFSQYRRGVDDARAALAEERDTLSKCMNVGPIAVDVPIDLQGLPAPDDICFIWELTKRPVDYAFGAMAPLADRLGACVARFKAVLSEGDLVSVLGRRLFETYPAGTLKLLGLPHQSYKGVSGRELCSVIGIRLGIDNCDLLDDELDAVICAVTAAAPAVGRVTGMRLVRTMHNLAPPTEMTPRGQKAPSGFVVLEQWPCRRLTISKTDFSAWMKANV